MRAPAAQLRAIGAQGFALAEHALKVAKARPIRRGDAASANDRVAVASAWPAPAHNGRHRPASTRVVACAYAAAASTQRRGAGCPRPPTLVGRRSSRSLQCRTSGSAFVLAHSLIRRVAARGHPGSGNRPTEGQRVPRPPREPDLVRREGGPEPAERRHCDRRLGPDTQAKASADHPVVDCRDGATSELPA